MSILGRRCSMAISCCPSAMCASSYSSCAASVAWSSSGSSPFCAQLPRRRPRPPRAFAASHACLLKSGEVRIYLTSTCEPIQLQSGRNRRRPPRCAPWPPRRLACSQRVGLEPRRLAPPLNISVAVISRQPLPHAACLCSLACCAQLLAPPASPTPRICRLARLLAQKVKGVTV